MESSPILTLCKFCLPAFVDNLRIYWLTKNSKKVVLNKLSTDSLCNKL